MVLPEKYIQIGIKDMKERAYAKINLALDVKRRREDGYHDLEMIMAPITRHDLLYIDVIDEGIEISTNNRMIPVNEKNIVYKIISLVKDIYHIEKGVRVHIFKHIPMQAGLAGGSADGAACLRALNRLFRLNLGYDVLAELGGKVGADIPFCVYQKMAFVQGTGEKLEFIDGKLDCHLLLVKPKRGVSTKLAFSRLDLAQCDHPDCGKMKQAIINHDYQGVIDQLGNSLEQPSLQLVKDIEQIREDLLTLGFDGALMSGSGSCVFGLTRDTQLLDRAHETLRRKYPFVCRSMFQS